MTERGGTDDLTVIQHLTTLVQGSSIPGPLTRTAPLVIWYQAAGKKLEMSLLT